MKQGFLISALGSGRGKTMITLGLIRAFQKRGKKVSCFKTGPDYIDTMYHTRVAGEDCVNLDPYFLEPDYRPGALQTLFLRNSRDFSIVEGAMGLFDGIYGEGCRASANTVAMELGLPTVLVVLPEEVEKLPSYLKTFPHRVQAFLLNKDQSRSCGEDAFLQDLAKRLGLVYLGSIPHVPELAAGSRHLGLVPPEKDLMEKVEKVGELANSCLNLKWLEKRSILPSLHREHIPSPIGTPEKRFRLAFARDEAFSFTYAENLRVLEEYGFELCWFSPLQDQTLPKNLDALWLCGGYPELYAGEIAKNISLRQDIQRAVRGGLPIIGECGGFMALLEEIEDPAGNAFPGFGILPGRAFATPRLVRFGYIHVEAKEDTLLLKKGQGFRSHEFHYWDSTQNGEACIARKANGSRSWSCVAAGNHIFAGFPHIYLRGHEFIVENLIQAIQIRKGEKCTKDQY